MPASKKDKKKMLRELQREERRSAITKYRLAGLSYDEIGKHLGITKQAVAKQYHEIMDEMRAEYMGNADQLILQELNLLNSLHRSYIVAAKNGDATAAGVVLRCHDSRKKLLGLDQAERVHVKVDDPLDDQIWHEFERLLARSQSDPEGAITIEAERVQLTN